MKPFFIKLIVNTLLAPPAALWAYYQEKRICKIGEPLDELNLIWAKTVGITHPENICLVQEQGLHLPVPSTFMSFLEQRGFGLKNAAGVCLRNGIFISSKAQLNRRLLRHELGHTFQYQLCGSLYKFMCQYLFECIYYGYHHAPMEIEAEEFANQSTS